MKYQQELYKLQVWTEDNKSRQKLFDIKRQKFVNKNKNMNLFMSQLQYITNDKGLNKG